MYRYSRDNINTIHKDVVKEDVFFARLLFARRWFVAYMVLYFHF